MASRYTAEEIATGVAVLGKRPDAVFLRERLILEVLAVTGPTMEPCALSYREGRRSMASDLLKLMDLDLDDAHRDASHTIRSGSAGSRPSGTDRRVPIEPAAGYGRGPRPAGRSNRRRVETDTPSVDA
jgi:hypothetical protein